MWGIIWLVIIDRPGHSSGKSVDGNDGWTKKRYVVMCHTSRDMEHIAI